MVADILSFTIPRLKTKDLVRIKGRLFVNLPSPTESLLRKKRSWQGYLKGFEQTQGQAQDRTRATQGYLKDKKD